MNSVPRPGLPCPARWLRVVLLLLLLATTVHGHEAGTPRIVNLSCRTRVGGAAGTPIAGFVLAGSVTTPVLVRSAGPALTGFGINGALADPRLSIFAGTSRVAANDNWALGDATAMAASGAFPFAAGSRDAAIVASLAPGAYTVPMEGAEGTSGITLAEVYQTSESGGLLVNASMRAHVDTGDAALIVGFNLVGHGSLRVLLRAVGPRLAAFGVTGAVADPVMTLYRDNVPIGTNDNWGSADNAAGVAATAASVGAFNSPQEAVTRRS